MSMKRAMIALAVGLAMAISTGCATFTDLFGGEGSTGAKTAVQFATLKVIDEDTERAQRVVEIVDHVRELVDGNTTATLDQVEQTVRDEIEWSELDAAEQLVVSNLIDAVRAELDARISDGTLDADERVAVGNVLDWVSEAAAMAGGVSGAKPETVTRADAALAGREAGLAALARFRTRDRPGEPAPIG